LRDNIEINEDTIFQVPLIIPIASKYFEKIESKSKDTYYRAVDLRLCLEKICDEFVYEFINDVHKKDWNKKRLHAKLLICKEYIDENCVNVLIKAKNIGNDGAHDGEEGSYIEEEFVESQKAILDFSLEVFVFYFRKYGYANLQNGGSWIPYVFSTLPPLYRVKVLRKYLEFNKEGIVIEKLAMAYAKCKMHDEMVDFLDECLQNDYINHIQYFSLLHEMKKIEDNLPNLRIAKTMKDAKENFKCVCNQIASCCNLANEPFIVLMSLVFYGNKDCISY